MANKPEQKPVWQYAKEARERKAAAAAGEPAASPSKPAVKAQKPQVKEELVTVRVSNPDVDFNARVIPRDFQKRAGIATYADELKERLTDIDEAADGAYFLLPVKLPKKVYKQLLLQAIAMSDVSTDWTERDQLEAIIIFSKTKT